MRHGGGLTPGGSSIVLAVTLKQRAEQAFAAVEVELRDISRWLYENPEVGLEELLAAADAVLAI